MLYEFKLSYNPVEVTKNICCEKGESTVDHSTVSNQMVEEILLGCKESR